MKTTTNTITSFDQLSLTLNATQVAAVLGISRANAYELCAVKASPRCTSAGECLCRRIA